MKRGFFVFALVTTMAGVASAFALAPQEPAARPAAGTLPLPVVAKPVTAPVVPTGEPAVRKTSFEIRHAPVPLLMKPRPPIEQPTFDADAVGPQAPPQANDAFGESAAKAAVEADGYKGVKVLRKGDNGIWYARALRGTTEVPLTVDAAGHVALE